jgi:hypothetical protein
VGFKDRPLSCLVLSEFGKTVLMKGETMDVDAQAKVIGQFSCGLCEKRGEATGASFQDRGRQADKFSQRT